MQNLTFSKSKPQLFRHAKNINARMSCTWWLSHDCQQKSYTSFSTAILRYLL